MKKMHLAILGVIATIVIVSIVTYAAIQYYGQVTTKVPVEQAIWVDAKRYNETITETLDVTYGGCTAYANHTLENRGDDNAKVEFALVNVTDSQGNLVTDITVEVSWVVNGQEVDEATIAPHETTEFSIAIHFHYAIMPDTYTINTQVKPHMP